MLLRFAAGRLRAQIAALAGGYRGPGISAGLCTSPYSTDCIIISPGARDVRHAVSEDSQIAMSRPGPFLLIVRTRRVVTARSHELVARDSRMFQHIADCFSRRHRRGGQHGNVTFWEEIAPIKLPT